MGSPLYSISSTPHAGFAVTALKAIPQGHLILSDVPLLQVVRSETTQEELAALVDALPVRARTAYRALCKSDPTVLDDWSVLCTNGFNLRSDESRTGVYELLSRFNHSCTPNAAHQLAHPPCSCSLADHPRSELNKTLDSFNPITLRGELWSILPISAGSEISISYISTEQPLLLRQMELKRRYQFCCTCISCTLPTVALQRSSDINRYTAQRLGNLVTNDPETFALPLYAVSRRIALLLKEGLGGPFVAQTLYEGFQLCAAYGQLRLASLYARLAAVVRRECEGVDSANARQMDAYAADPTLHAASETRKEGTRFDELEDVKELEGMVRSVDSGESLGRVLEALEAKAWRWLDDEDKEELEELLEGAENSMLVAGN